MALQFILSYIVYVHVDVDHAIGNDSIHDLLDCIVVKVIYLSYIGNMNMGGTFGKVIIQMVELLYGTWIMLWFKSLIFSMHGLINGVNGGLVGMYYGVNEMRVEATCIYCTSPLPFLLATP
jgi:hypothetical protein